MSFILDALRKSEHDRQRQSGPGLAEIPVAVAKPKVNVWATAAIALLIVNLIAVGVVLLRRANDTGSGSAGTASAAAPANGSAVPTSASPAIAAAPQASLTQTRPQPQPTLQDPPPIAQGPSARNPLKGEMSSGAQDIDAGMAMQAASVPAGPPAVSQVPSGRGSVVYAPIPEAAEQSAVQSAAQSIEQAGLPTAEEVTSRGGVPELHLDLHVFSTRAQDRFIFVNSRKYREGDTLQEGPVVEQITQGGAVLNYRGSRFVLSRD